jgi:hypothetical protein
MITPHQNRVRRSNALMQPEADAPRPPNPNPDSLSFYLYRRATANIKELAINPLATCACLTEFDVFVCEVPGALPVFVLVCPFPVLVTIPDAVVAVLKLNTTAVGSTKPQVGAAGPAVALTHTPITHWITIFWSTHFVPVRVGARSRI